MRLGNALLNLVRHEQAIVALSFARLAACQYALGDPEGARASLAQALKIGPEIDEEFFTKE